VNRASARNDFHSAQMNHGNHFIGRSVGHGASRAGSNLPASVADIPAAPTGLAMEELREPIPSSMAAASTEEASTVDMEAMAVGTGDRIRRC